MNDLEYKMVGGVAVLSLAEGADGVPGVLDGAARAAYLAALDRAAADGAVRAVVIAGQGRSFPGGLPEEEIAAGEVEPTLDALCRRVAEFPKPVVAALRGDVFDAGFALALAAHARLAAPGTRVGLADIRRGLVPAGGAAQRLPGLIGAAAALDMIFAGRIFGIESGRLRGLVRRVVPRNVVGEAVTAAGDLADTGGWQAGDAPAPGQTDPLGYQAEIARRREGATPLPPEAEAALECVEAAQLLPLEAGLAMEQALREELRGTARAQGLTRTTALETRAARPMAGAPEHLTVLGDGPAGFALVRRGLAAGLAVAVAEQREGGAETMIRRMAAQLDHEVRQGRLGNAQRDDQMARLTGGAAEPALGAAEAVIEASAAPVDAMEGLRALALRVTGHGVPVLLSSNTGLHAGDLAALYGGRVLGLAVSETQQRGGRGLAELTGDAIEVAVDRASEALMRRLGFTVVRAHMRNGLIAERLKAAMLGAAEWCVAQGAAPPAVDRAMGWTQGPFHQADAEGLETQAARFEALRWPEAFGALFSAFTEARRGGRASGRGIFSYAQHGAGGDYDAAAQGIVAGWRGTGDEAALGAAEIRRRVWSAMFSAGLRLLDRGVAADAGDIDLAALEALGLPRASGGPMKTGEIRGLIAVRRELEAWHEDAPALWLPSDRLDEMIKNGSRVDG